MSKKNSAVQSSIEDLKKENKTLDMQGTSSTTQVWCTCTARIVLYLLHGKLGTILWKSRLWWCLELTVNALKPFVFARSERAQPVSHVVLVFQFARWTEQRQQDCTLNSQATFRWMTHWAAFTTTQTLTNPTTNTLSVRARNWKRSRVRRIRLGRHCIVISLFHDSLKHHVTTR